MARNVAALVKPPTVPRYQWHALPPAALRQLLTTAAGTEYEAFWWLMVTTGARVGEILGLRWADVDWEHRTISIHQQAQTLGGRASIRVDTKRAASRRPVLLPPLVIAQLERHRLTQAQARAQAPTWEDYDLVFCTRQGRPVSNRHVRRVFKRLLAQAGLPLATRVHDLRHSLASVLLANGVPINVMAERLGHSRASTTLNVYAHVLPGAQEQVAGQIERLLAIPQE